MARALVNGPKLILADEPTGNLDEFSASVVYELLSVANSVGKTVVIVTHQIPKDLSVKYRRFVIEDKKVKEL